MLFYARGRAFRIFSDVPRRGIYDNMRTAIDSVGVGKQRWVNARCSAIASHYLLGTDFCNSASGWEKGQVEKKVQDARHRLWQPTPRFATLSDLNDWLEQRAISRRPAGIDRRCLDERGHLSKAAGAHVRRFRRMQQARVADLPHSF
jgi:transposase